MAVCAQVMLEYLDKKTRAMQQQNKIAAWAMCLVQGLMWLLEKIVAFINRNAFILVAGEGVVPHRPVERQPCNC
jgi:choline transporter-like protein 2/4/5